MAEADKSSRRQDRADSIRLDAPLQAAGQSQRRRGVIPAVVGGLGGVIVGLSVNAPWLEAGINSSPRSAAVSGPLGMRLIGAALGVAAITSAAGVRWKLGSQRRLFVAGLLISGAASIAFSGWYVLSGRAHALLPPLFDVQECFSVFGGGQGPPGCVVINYPGPNVILYGGMVVLVSAIITAVRIRMRPDREVRDT